jgi:hypothetical protein
MLSARRLVDPRAAISLPVCALLFSTALLTRTQPGPDACAWLTPGTLFNTLGHHFGPPEKDIAPQVYPGQGRGAKCHYNGLNDSAFDVTFIGYVDASAGQAKATFEKLAGFVEAAGKLDGNNAGARISGIGDDAYLDNDSALHVLKGKVRYFFDVGGFPNKQQSLRDLANRVNQAVSGL